MSLSLVESLTHELVRPPVCLGRHAEREPDLAGCTNEKTRYSNMPIGSFPWLNNAGSDLLSHTVSHAVPSAVSGLTSVFGMGTGVTLIL